MNEIMLWHQVAAIAFVFLIDTANAFTCQQKGIFRNTDSNDCKTFISCDDNLIPQVYECREGTYFWPEQKGCFSQYDCAASLMPGNVNPCGEANADNIPDKSSADCTKYLQCGTMYVWQHALYVKVVRSLQCPTGTAFRPRYGCSSSHKCANYQCTAEGSFQNPNDCSSFIQCWKYESETNSGGFVSLLYPDLNQCPPNTKFNPLSKKCDAFYKCDGIDPHGGVDPCLNYNPKNPNVVNPYDKKATSYIVCEHRFDYFLGTKNVLLKRECPANTFFSPILRKCYNNYNPKEGCSKDACSAGPGKYVDYESSNCRNYFECRDESTNSDIYKPTYEIRYCPRGTKYSPETSDCSRQYVCPTYPANYCYPQTTTTTTTMAPATGSPVFYALPRI